MKPKNLQNDDSDAQSGHAPSPSEIKYATGNRDKIDKWNSHASRYGPTYVGHLVERISDANRAEFVRFLRVKEAQGIKISSVTQCAYNVFKLDKMARGKPFGELTPEDLTDAMLGFARSHSPSTVATWAGQVKAFYAWRNGGLCPHPIRLALRRKNIGRENRRAPIPQEVFDKLVEAARDTFDRERAAFRVAFLWTLWDSGFRISEALSLRVGNITFRNGGAELALPADAPDLKTGPRTIFVMECVGPLKAWLAIHPNPKPEAPLWPAHRAYERPMMRTNVDNMLARIAARTNVKAPHPHLFRHTRATRAARAGWNVHQMNRYFGWSGNSSMASNYVHLVLSDVEDRVKADFGPVNLLAPQKPSAPAEPTESASAPALPQPAGLDAAAIGAAIAAALAAVEATKKR